jgi:DNA-binding response OmpR family regulator
MRRATRILVVDGEPNARSALAELLRDEGYAVSSAVDGRAAQRSIADFHPDLVLTDVGMQAALRTGSHGPAVVIMSARPRPVDDSTPFIAKPIEIEALMATVKCALARRRAP